MTTAQIIHMWFAVVCFGAAVLGIAAMLIGYVMPPRSKAGGITFTAGLCSAIGSVIVYLVYIVAMVISVAVMRS